MALWIAGGVAVGTWTARHTGMTKLMSIRTWPLIALLGASLVAACGADDDDGGIDNGGRAGSSHAGTTSGGTSSQGGKTSEGGKAGSQGTAGNHSAGTST